MSEPMNHAMDANGTSNQVNQEEIVLHNVKEKQDLPIYETKVSFSSNVMEEDSMELEPGLVFFEVRSLYLHTVRALFVPANFCNTYLFLVYMLGLLYYFMNISIP